MTFGESVKRFARNKFLGDLSLNSWATCRLNSMLWERCLAMAFILRKPGSPGQFQSRKMSTARGALHRV